MVLRRCSICDRNFTKAEHYLRHQRSHTKERPYECPVCKKRFSRSDVLFRHSKLHTEKQGDDPNQKPSNDDVDHIRHPSLGKLTPDNEHKNPLNGLDRPVGPNANCMQQPHFQNPQAFSSAHMAMPNFAMGHMNFESSPAQPNNAPRHMSATTFSTQDYSPMPEFRTPVNGHVDMSMPAYDPQLVQLNPHLMQQHPADTFGTQSGTSSIEDSTPDILHYWLSQAENDFEYAAIAFPPPTGRMSVNAPMPPPARMAAPSETSDVVSTTSNIPNERFARVESAWVASGKMSKRLVSSLWRDVAQCSGPSIFTCGQSTPTQPTPRSPENRWGVDTDLKQRLEVEFGVVSNVPPQSGKESFPRPRNLSFPPPEVLDICLDAYFQRFHPMAPFVHPSTFSASSAPLPLLYAMCLLGLCAMKSNEGGNFLKHAFNTMLRRCMSDLADDGSTTASTVKRLSTYAAATLTLNLAAVSGDPEQIAQGQMLHANLLSNAQKQGFFAVNEVPEECIIGESMDDTQRWHAWARIESVKRLAVCMLTIDWWFSAYSSVSPICRPEATQIILPGDEELFKAGNAMRWAHLLRSGKKLAMPLIRPCTFEHPGSLDPVICLDPSLAGFGQYSLLSILKSYQCDTQHRHFMFSDEWDRHDHLVPWQAFSEDTRGRSLVPIVICLTPIVTATPRTADLNSLVLWHNICMTLNANVQIFELAAGRTGVGPAGRALADITEWTHSPSARRACIHAASVFKLMSNRKVSDPISINTLTGLFHAALVMGLYLFTVARDPADLSDNTFEILDDVDWVTVGDAAMADKSTASSPTMDFETGQSPSPALDFIERGGIVSFGGAVAPAGYMSARRTFLEYAHLMDSLGTWKQRALSRILHIMSDVLEESA